MSVIDSFSRKEQKILNFKQPTFKGKEASVIIGSFDGNSERQWKTQKFKLPKNKTHMSCRG